MDESNTDSLSSHVDKSLKATEEDDSELLHQNIFLSETTNKANQANIMKSGIPIKNFKKAKDMQQKGLESARTARKIVNPGMIQISHCRNEQRDIGECMDQ